MKNKKDIKQKSQSDESDSKVGNYGKEFGYWSVQMESMIGPTEVPANGSAYPMNCDYPGVVFENDGGIGMIDLPKCKKCGMVCVDQIIAEPSEDSKTSHTCGCKAKNVTLGVVFKEEVDEECYYNLSVGAGTVYLKVKAGESKSELKTVFLYEGSYPLGPN